MSGDSGSRWERWRTQVSRQHAVRRGRTLGLMLLGALAVGNADCAQERDPINRVQPMALNKHFFVGRDLVDGTDDPQRFVQMATAFGGRRVVDWLSGEPLPRIC